MKGNNKQVKMIIPTTRDVFIFIIFHLFSHINDNTVLREIKHRRNASLKRQAVHGNHVKCLYANKMGLLSIKI